MQIPTMEWNKLLAYFGYYIEVYWSVVSTVDLFMVDAAGLDMLLYFHMASHIVLAGNRYVLKNISKSTTIKRMADFGICS